MELTRIDTKKLTAAVTKAMDHLEQAAKIMDPYSVLLTDSGRAVMLRPRDGFPRAGRSLARAMEKHPEVMHAVDYDPQAVVEDLDNVEAIAPLVEKVASFEQRLADSKLTWLAEAYQPSLAVYQAAKARARTDAAVADAIKPLADALAMGRRAKKTVEAPK